MPMQIMEADVHSALLAGAANQPRGVRVLIIAGLDRSLINFRLPLIRALQDAGCRVECCAPAENDEVSTELARIGVPLHSLPLERRGVNPFADLRAVSALVRVVRKVQPTLTLAYTHKPIIYAGLVGRVTGRTVHGLVTGLGSVFGSKDTLRQRLAYHAMVSLYRLATPGLSGIIFQNRDDEADFRRLGLISGDVRSAVVAGSGIDLDDFPFESVAGRDPHFVLLARLLGSKGIREFAAAGALVRQEFPAARLSLAGGFDEREVSRITASEIKRWEDDGVLCYHGVLRDVRPLLREATVSVLPSYYREGVPRSLLEGLAMGRAIITTDAIGCRETVRLPVGAQRDGDGILKGENGLLVPVRNARVLAVAMSRLARNPELVGRMGARSREIAEAEFDVRRVNAHMLAAMGIPAKGGTP
jgi:glycosyltransferase involved in cell wall biosynthesis